MLTVAPSTRSETSTPNDKPSSATIPEIESGSPTVASTWGVIGERNVTSGAVSAPMRTIIASTGTWAPRASIALARITAEVPARPLRGMKVASQSGTGTGIFPSTGSSMIRTSTRGVSTVASGASSTVKRTTWKSEGRRPRDLQSPLVIRITWGSPSSITSPAFGAS